MRAGTHNEFLVWGQCLLPHRDLNSWEVRSIGLRNKEVPVRFVRAFLRREMKSEPSYRTQEMEGGVSKPKEQVEWAFWKLAVREAWRGRMEGDVGRSCCCFHLLCVCFKTHRILISLGTMPIRREEPFGNIKEGVGSAQAFIWSGRRGHEGRWRTGIPSYSCPTTSSSIPLSLKHRLLGSILSIFTSHTFINNPGSGTTFLEAKSWLHRSLVTELWTAASPLCVLVYWPMKCRGP